MLRGPLGRTSTLILTLAAALLLTAAAAQRQSTAEPWKPEIGPGPVALEGLTHAAWVTSFGSRQTDWVNDVVPLAAGDFVAVGFVDRAEGDMNWDGVVHRFAADGSPKWTRRLGGPGLDALWSGHETADGRLALVGFSTSGGAGGTDVWLVLLSADDGSLLAERWFGGAGTEQGIDVLPASDGGFLLVGQSDSIGAGQADVYLLHTDAQGRELWTRTWGGPEVDRGFYGVATADGGFVVSGVTGAEGAYDMLVLKVDETGQELWHRVIGGEGNDPSHGINVLPEPDGRIVVVGYTDSWGAREHDILAVMLSRKGGVLTADLVGGPGDDRVMSSLTGLRGQTWLVGHTTSLGAGGRDIMIALLGAAGRFEPWMAALGTAGDDRGGALAMAEGGQLVVGGDSNALDGGNGPNHLLLARLDPEALVRSEAVRTRPLRPQDVIVSRAEPEAAASGSDGR